MTPVADRPIYGVVFDLDGTLLQTEKMATESLEMIANKFDKKLTWEANQLILGLRPLEWAPLLIKALEVDGLITPAEMIEQFEDYMHELTPDVEKCEGAETTTSLLNELGIPQSIATSSTKAGVSAKRPRHEEMFGRMEHVVTGDDPEVIDGKPAPDIYLVAAKRMGLEPKHCLAFEDALSGLKSAKAAGMFVVSIPDARLDTAPFVEAGADLILKSMKDWDASAWTLKAPEKRTSPTTTKSEDCVEITHNE